MKKTALIVVLTSLSCLLQSCASWRVSSGTPTNQNTNIGRRVKVLWGGSWYDAIILDGRNNEYYIHYDGWSDSQNEWVTMDRIQFSNSNYYVGQWVEVEQRGTWYAAHIVQVNNNQYYIHYDGWGDSQNEWVTMDRIRFKQ